MAEHIPVLCAQVMQGLNIQKGGTYVDATFGRGGYSRAMLAEGAGKVIAFDKDPQATPHAEQLSAEFPGSFQYHADCFSQMDQHLSANTVAGVAFDLGVSSPQLDEAARGFSFQQEGPLDMRMHNIAGETAADVVNTYGGKEIADILYQLGEERQSRRIARAIVTARQEAPFTTTTQLASCIMRAMRGGRQKIHPATRSFQALRLHVNRELDVLEGGLNAALQCLQTSGRLACVSFHSLEDRIVKFFIRGHSKPEDGQPVLLKTLTKKPLVAEAEEARANPRARSAKLRIAEKQ